MKPEVIRDAKTNEARFVGENTGGHRYTSLEGYNYTLNTTIEYVAPLSSLKEDELKKELTAFNFDDCND